MVSDPTLQLTFNQLLFVEFLGGIKGKYPQLPEKNIKYFFFLQLHFHVTGFFSRLLLKQHILQQSKCRSRYDRLCLCSIKPDTNKMSKTQNNASFLTVFVLENILIFIKMLFILTWNLLIISELINIFSVSVFICNTESIDRYDPYK